MLEGIPCLVLDPKGDMTNLALNFPDLRLPTSDRGWTRQPPYATAKTPTRSRRRLPRMWARGLESWGLGTEQMRHSPTPLP
jgi:hypothetical protein